MAKGVVAAQARRGCDGQKLNPAEGFVRRVVFE
jgi:hypothetical protein